jgi:hypothetical protein
VHSCKAFHPPRPLPCLGNDIDQLLLCPGLADLVQESTTVNGSSTTTASAASRREAASCIRVALPAIVLHPISTPHTTSLPRLEPPLATPSFTTAAVALGSRPGAALTWAARILWPRSEVPHVSRPSLTQRLLSGPPASKASAVTFAMNSAVSSCGGLPVRGGFARGGIVLVAWGGWGLPWLIVILPHLYIVSVALEAVSGVGLGGLRGWAVGMIHARRRASIAPIRGRWLPRVSTGAPWRHAWCWASRRRAPPLLHVAVGACLPRGPVVIVLRIAASPQAHAAGVPQHCRA